MSAQVVNLIFHIITFFALLFFAGPIVGILLLPFLVIYLLNGFVFWILSSLFPVIQDNVWIGAIVYGFGLGYIPSTILWIGEVCHNYGK